MIRTGLIPLNGLNVRAGCGGGGGGMRRSLHEAEQVHMHIMSLSTCSSSRTRPPHWIEGVRNKLGRSIA